MSTTAGRCRAATVVIDIGDRPATDLFAAEGPAPPAFIVGAGTVSYPARIGSAQTVMTIHFRPGGALPFTGVALGALTDCRVELGELWGRAAIALREQLTAAPSFTATTPTNYPALRSWLRGHVDLTADAEQPAAAESAGKNIQANRPRHRR